MTLSEKVLLQLRRRWPVVFIELFVKDPQTDVDFLVLVLQTSLLSTGALRKRIGIFAR